MEQEKEGKKKINEQDEMEERSSFSSNKDKLFCHQVLLLTFDMIIWLKCDGQTCHDGFC